MLDLHLHSTCSDGSETPAHVVELAAEAGCSAIALTDHDGLGGIAPATARASELGIGFVPGCEVSCDFSPGSMHVLCYFIEDVSGPLQNELLRLQEEREQRNLEMADRLVELGLPITFEEVVAKATSSVIGRPHFAAVLIDNGAVNSINEAFDRYLGKGAAGYVGRAPVSAAEIIDLARASGGVAVVAHPLSLGLDPDPLARELTRLQELGLAGVECHYGNYLPAMRTELIGIAQRVGLVATGGSDFHGRFKPDLHVGSGRGDLIVPDEALAELASRRTLPSPPAA